MKIMWFSCENCNENTEVIYLNGRHTALTCRVCGCDLNVISYSILKELGFGKVAINKQTLTN